VNAKEKKEKNQQNLSKVGVRASRKSRTQRPREVTAEKPDAMATRGGAARLARLARVWNNIPYPGYGIALCLIFF
jgi:hypothetical protein